MFLNLSWINKSLLWFLMGVITTVLYYRWTNLYSFLRTSPLDYLKGRRPQQQINLQENFMESPPQKFNQARQPPQDSQPPLPLIIDPIDPSGSFTVPISLSMSSVKMMRPTKSLDGIEELEIRGEESKEETDSDYEFEPEPEPQPILADLTITN